MKKEFINEIKRMHQLAGIINESQLTERGDGEYGEDKISDYITQDEIDDVIELVLPLVEKVANAGRFDEQDVLKYIFEKVKFVI
jgi:hypothetical protein